MVELQPFNLMKPAGANITDAISTENSFIQGLFDDWGAFSRQGKGIRRLGTAVIVIWSFAYFLFVIPTVMFNASDDFSFFAFCLVGIGFLLSLGLIAVIGVKIWGFLIGSRLARPVMNANFAQVRRGDKLDLSFTQEVKSATRVQNMSIQLVLREWVKYTQGTNTYTDMYDHVIVEETFPEEQLERGMTLQKRATFAVPNDAMHTFQQSHNQLRWLVRVHLDIPGWIDFQELYEVVVLSGEAS